MWVPTPQERCLNRLVVKGWTTGAEMNSGLSRPGRGMALNKSFPTTIKAHRREAQRIDVSHLGPYCGPLLPKPQTSSSTTLVSTGGHPREPPTWLLTKHNWPEEN